MGKKCRLEFRLKKTDETRNYLLKVIKQWSNEWGKA